MSSDEWLQQAYLPKDEVEGTARKILARYLPDWKLRILKQPARHTVYTTLGQCETDRKTIAVSLKHVWREDLLDTMLHEIAHARVSERWSEYQLATPLARAAMELAGNEPEKPGHGPKWRAESRRLLDENGLQHLAATATRNNTTTIRSEDEQ